MTNLRLKPLIISLLLLILFSGCGYRLQTKAELPFESVSIGEIKNLTYEPKLQDKMRQSLIDALMTQGFRISKNAKYRIDGDLTAFNLTVLSEVGLTASEYSVDLTGNFVITDTENGKSYPVKTYRPFTTHFTVKERLSEVIDQKELYTKRACNELASEIVWFMLYDLPLMQKK